MNQSNVLITGASGLIGTPLAAALAREHTVVGLDLAEPAPDWQGHAFVRCDLTDDRDVSAALGRVRDAVGGHLSSVVHLAAYYDFAGEPSPLYDELTVRGTVRLLRALQSLAVEQLVFSSTLLVMRPAEPGEIIHEGSATQGGWDYPRSKLRAEAAIREHAGPIPAVVMRLAGLYDEWGHSPPLTQQMARIRERRLESHLFPGDPGRGQPFLHLQDAVSCLVAAVDRRAELGPHEVFLVAEPEIVSYGELQELLGELVHREEWTTLRIPAPVAKAGAWVKEKLPGGEEEFIKPWMVDLADEHYPVSIERARARLRWEPRHRLRTTLPAMVERMMGSPRAWYEENGIPFPGGGEGEGGGRGEGG